MVGRKQEKVVLCMALHGERDGSVAYRFAIIQILLLNPIGPRYPDKFIEYAPSKLTGVLFMKDRAEAVRPMGGKNICVRGADSGQMRVCFL